MFVLLVLVALLSVANQRDRGTPVPATPRLARLSFCRRFSRLITSLPSCRVCHTCCLNLACQRGWIGVRWYITTATLTIECADAIWQCGWLRLCNLIIDCLYIGWHWRCG